MNQLRVFLGKFGHLRDQHGHLVRHVPRNGQKVLAQNNTQIRDTVLCLRHLVFRGARHLIKGALGHARAVDHVRHAGVEPVHAVGQQRYCRLPGLRTAEHVSYCLAALFRLRLQDCQNVAQGHAAGHQISKAFACCLPQGLVCRGAALPHLIQHRVCIGGGFRCGNTFGSHYGVCCAQLFQGHVIGICRGNDLAHNGRQFTHGHFTFVLYLDQHVTNRSHLIRRHAVSVQNGGKYVKRL